MATLQIRNVPEDLHSRLTARAAQSGMSLSDYALAELCRGMERPTRSELLERLATRPILTLRTSTTAAVRRDRAAVNR